MIFKTLLHQYDVDRWKIKLYISWFSSQIALPYPVTESVPFSNGLNPSSLLLFFVRYVCVPLWLLSPSLRWWYMWQLSLMGLNLAMGWALSASGREYLVSMSDSKCWKQAGVEIVSYMKFKPLHTNTNRLNTHFLTVTYTYQVVDSTCRLSLFAGCWKESVNRVCVCVRVQACVLTCIMCDSHSSIAGSYARNTI